MAQKALFEGLVVDEGGDPVDVVYVGDEPCYVVDDQGFRRHVPAEEVDRQVLRMMQDMVEGHEDIISEQAAKMLGQDDPFSRASIINQLKNLESQFDKIMEHGFPEEQRAYMGMMGFQVKIDIHGEVIDLIQPGMIEPD